MSTIITLPEVEKKKQEEDDADVFRGHNGVMMDYESMLLFRITFDIQIARGLG
jgi:hypothetical protein